MRSSFAAPSEVRVPATMRARDCGSTAEAEQRDLGDVTTLADATVVNTIREQSGRSEE